MFAKVVRASRGSEQWQECPNMFRERKSDIVGLNNIYEFVVLLCLAVRVYRTNQDARAQQ